MPQDEEVKKDGEAGDAEKGSSEAFVDISSEEEYLGREIADEESPEPASLYEEEETVLDDDEASVTEKVKKGIRSAFDNVVKMLMVPEDSSALLDDDDELEEDIFGGKLNFFEKMNIKSIFGKNEADKNETDKEEKSVPEDNEAEDGHPPVIDEPQTDSRNETKPEKIPLRSTKRKIPSGVLASASMYKSTAAEKEDSVKKAVKPADDNVGLSEEPKITKNAENEVQSHEPETAVEAPRGFTISGRSEITIDDILKVKNSASANNQKTYIRASVTPENTMSDRTVKTEQVMPDNVPYISEKENVKVEPVQSVKEAQITDVSQKPQEFSHDQSKRTEPPRVQKPQELSHDQPKRTELPKVQKPQELSHDQPKRTELPKVQKPQELSHDQPKRTEPPKVQKPQELSHDQPKRTEPPKVQKPQELSHDQPKRTEPPRVQKPQELSHDQPKRTEPPRVQKPQELSHDQPKRTEPPRVQKPQELSHDQPKRTEQTRFQKPHKASYELQKKIELSKEQTPDDNEANKTANGLPGGDGISIEPWEPPKSLDGRDSEIIYRSPEINPFVVMAGKFSRTLKAEYESTRRMRKEFEPEKPVMSEPYEEVKKPVRQQAVKKSVKKSEPVHINDNAPERKTNSAHKPPEHIPKVTKINGDENKKKKPAPVKQKEKAARSSGAKPSDKSKRNEKKKFRFRDIFDYEGDRFDEEEEEEVVKTEISDYSKAEDAGEIRDDINENFSKVFVRTLVLLCTCLGSIITVVVAKTMPQIFVNNMKNGWLVYSAIMFLLFLVSVYLSRFPIFNGFTPLKRFRGNSDTPLAVASLAVAVQSIVSLFQPDVFLNETYHIYVPLLILALLLNSMGKLLIIRRTADNFRFLRSDKAEYAGKIYTNSENADRFVSGLSSRRPIIAYSKLSEFMSNFLQLSYASDPVEELSAVLAPIFAFISLVAAVAYGIAASDLVGGISFFAMASCITLPMCSLLAVNIPMLNLCASANRSGAMIVGYEAVKQFSDTNTIMFESSDLYPKGNIVLSGMKTLNESKLREAISAGASMTFAVNGPLTHVFETIVRQSKVDLPEYESVSYVDDMGLSGWCSGNRILIGRRELFVKHNIRLPDESIEARYRKRGNEIVYISVAGEVAVMFILTYKVDRAIAEGLRELEDSGVNFVVRTLDPNVNQKHIAEKFGLYPKCIKILPTVVGQSCHEELSGKEKSSRAYLVTDGKLSSFAKAVAGCIRIRSTITIAKIIQYLSIIAGFILVTIIAFVSGFAKLGSVELLLYIGFWCAAMIIVSIAARKLS